MPSRSTYRLTWVSLTLDVGYFFTAAPAKRSHCSLPWTRGISWPPLLTLNVEQLLLALLRLHSRRSLDVVLLLSSIDRASPVYPQESPCRVESYFQNLPLIPDFLSFQTFKSFRSFQDVSLCAWGSILGPRKER